MEYDYREYRKDSQAVLREKNSRREKMDHFLSSEGRKKEGREPEKKLEIGNLTERLKSGFRKQQRKRTGKMFRKLRKNWQSYRDSEKIGEKNSGITNMSVKMGLCRFRFCKRERL